MEKTKGWKTSEFWTLVCTTVGALVNQAGVFKFQIPMDTVNDLCTTAIAYISSRSVLKAVAAYAAAKFANATIQPADNSTINGKR